MSKTSPNKVPEASLEDLLRQVQPEIGRILENALAGREISVKQAVLLFNTSGVELDALTAAADALRRNTVGNLVTYVVNRNINFTNVCIKGCGFCAFSRDHREEEGYFLPISEVVRRAQEAWEMGATEVCIQAGLPPKMEGDLYIRICEAIKKVLPDIHIHGFSPEEILYGSTRSKCSISEYLTALKKAGVGSLPGTSAEILDQRIRDIIAPGRITVSQWRDVITTAHKVGIPTTSTIMYGHIETSEQVAQHIAFIRNIQKETNGISEFVPLSFVHTEAPMYNKGTLKGIRTGPVRTETIKVHAISRLMLNNWIPNLQVSWPKEGAVFAQELLSAGVNDMGGTLINESISTAAGAQFGQLLRPRELRQLIRESGKIPAERYTNYKIRQIFDNGDDPIDPLDVIDEESEKRFGSYQKLIKMEGYRYAHPKYISQRSSEQQ